MQAPAATQETATSVSQLPNAAIDLANRMFNMARSGDATLLEYLGAGLPPNLTNNRGDTLLMLAAYHGHATLVRKMLEGPSSSEPAAEHGRSWAGHPDPNQLNGRGQSIVAGAVFKGYADVVKVLIEHGADPLAGQPSAQECAQMFGKWEGESGFRQLFEEAPGRGAGAREASAAVEDREEARRIPGVGLQHQSHQDTAQDLTPSDNTNSSTGGPNPQR
ncbi:hypothetical protein BCV70DRAFT_162196 [Testicularia cyperi]|uniref:Uncharacterized protein n=1 Tax=Testicularia cyperi TaxID=1882483 RepID=A0A317XRC6_9BASI|nr:hypothetical protein BCV70DRAFT_162196 [Testicularia cyperi]